ncbi:hypothetical protein [Alterinioella nitratireducens]|uniref:hypothetical protein n=1 Tax=Alterinioella nitratireducens TaxID=2735915 RepID=UPI0015523E8D|nr:hypothetical protein [Alterinioella nitratireducens]NPD20438.1 hypothetical protein [Alterinioella nitratireducens]
MDERAKLPVAGLLALLSFHLAIVLGAFIVADGEMAILFLLGIGYIWVLNAVAHIPFLIVPSIAALAAFAAMLCLARTRHWSFGIATGIAPIMVFVLIAEISTLAAMRIARAGLDAPTCLYGVQSFTSSTADLFANLEPLWGDTRRYRHHAHLALPDERLMMWSYSEMSFVTFEPSPFDVDHVPPDCADLLATP